MKSLSSLLKVSDFSDALQSFEKRLDYIVKLGDTDSYLSDGHLTPLQAVKIMFIHTTEITFKWQFGHSELTVHQIYTSIKMNIVGKDCMLEDLTKYNSVVKTEQRNI